MTDLHYRLLNVFTRSGEPLSGNPLCVFEDGTGLSDATMQALARQFNLSETTFLLPASSSAATARVRIFTPNYELPFAGHPTLGSAAVCRALGLGTNDLRLEMQAGIIAVTAQGSRWTLIAPRATWREIEHPREQLAGWLGLRPDDIAERPLWVKSGKEQLIVPLSSTEAVQRAAPIPSAFEHLRSEDGQGMAYVFAPFTGDRMLARFFFPQGNAVLEDPATGSATGNFGAWWMAVRRPIPVSLSVTQGEQIGRPSALYLTIDADAHVRVSGDVIELGRGELRL